jgi:hypothetical protein
MNIGDKVQVKATMEFYYDDNKCRRFERTPNCFEAFVTGAANKPIGKYVDGGPHYSYLDGPEYEPPYLDVTGTVRVYRVRKRLFGREFDVHPDDLVLLGGNNE